MTYAEYAHQYAGNGFEPIPVRSGAKTGIPAGATGHSGTVTPEKVTAWCEDSEWLNEDVALRALDTYIALDVDQYDGKHGNDEIEALELTLGQLPDTIISTARTLISGQRFYQVPAGLRFVSNATPATEVIQRSHRYSVVFPSTHVSGEQYKWFGADGEELWGLPTVADFAPLPDLWVKFLTKDATVTHAGFDGDVETWLETLVPGKPSEEVAHLITTLPVDNFTHNDVIRILYRIVRLGAEGNAGIRWALNVVETKWVKPPFDSNDYRKELSTAVAGAVTRGGALELPVLGDHLALMKRIDSNRVLADSLFDDNTHPTELVRDLFKEGFNHQEVFTLASKAAVNREKHPAVLWREVQDYEPMASTKPSDTFSLLTVYERERLQKTPTFVGLYSAITKERNSRPNMPLHRLMAWSALSLTFSGFGVIPTEDSDKGMGLNLYTMGISQSGSGKTPAFRQLHSFMEAVVGTDAFWGNCNLGTPRSAEALNTSLIGRDKLVSWVSDDDAYSFLEKLSDQKGYMGGLEGTFNKYYEGDVNAFLKNSDKDNSGKHAACVLSMTLVGTPHEMLSALTHRQITSGFVPRFITAFGDPRVVTKETLFPRQRVGEASYQTVDPRLKLLAEDMKHHKAEFAKKRRGEERYPMVLTEQAQIRLAKALLEARSFYTKHPQAELVESSMVRVDAIIWKAAALVAMSRGNDRIDVSDVLVAVEASEEWIPNMVKLIDGIAANDWVAQCDEVAAVIAVRPLSKAALYRRFKNKKSFELDQVTEALVSQGRVLYDQSQSKWLSKEEK